MLLINRHYININMISVSEIGTTCSTDGRCRGIRTRCDEQGYCSCQSGYLASYETKPYPRCKKQPLSGTRIYSLLGDECGGQKSCEDPDTVCLGGLCRCRIGLRTATQEEINAYPFNLLQCVANSFQLGMKMKVANI